MEIYQSELRKKKSKYDVNGDDNLCFWKSFLIYRQIEKGVETGKCLIFA